MTTTVTNIGELGTTDGILRPIDLTITKNGATWNIAGYTSLTLLVWNALTKATVTAQGTLAIETAASGVVRYTPAASDTLFANSGLYEARVALTPGGGGDPEHSALFRFTIGAGLGG